MWGLRSSRTVILGLATVVFVFACFLPLLYMIALSLEPGSVARTYRVLLLDARQRDLLYNSAALGGGAALLSTVLGVPLGVGLAWLAIPCKRLFRLALVAPLLLPPYVVGLAWIYLGSSTGIVATVAGRDFLSEWTYSLSAAIAVLGLVYYPLSMLATEVAVRRVDARLEEAALLVAPPGRVFAKITLPLAAPAIGAAALVIFVLAVSDFGVPGLLRVRVFTTEVFTAFSALYDFGRATALTVPLMVLATIVAVVATALVGDRLVAGRRALGGSRPLGFDRWRITISLFGAVVLIAALAMPLAVLVREALGAESIATVVRGSWSAIQASIMLAAIGATLVVAIAVWLGYARARAGLVVGRLADVLFVVLFAVPSTVVGVGLIGLWNRAGPFGQLYATDAMLLLAYLARFVPVAALVLAASVRQVPVSHEEAAAVAGAGWLRTVFRIVMPQAKLGILAAWIVAFILSFGELGASVLVAPPGESTLPIRIYTLIANTPSSHVAALALLQAAVIFGPLAVLGLATRSREVG